MVNRDLASNATIAPSIDPSDYAADSTTNGAAVAVKDYRWAYFALALGDMTTVSSDGTFSIEESTDGTTGWTAVAGATAAVANTLGGTTVGGQVDCHQRENFLRAVYVAGSTAATEASCVAVLTADRDTQYAGTPTAAAFSV